MVVFALDTGVGQQFEHVINNVQGVIKFVGQGRAPQPLREDEINKILGVEIESEKAAREEIPFHIGQVVEVTQGPFTDFSGTVQEVYPDKGKVKVEVIGGYSTRLRKTSHFHFMEVVCVLSESVMASGMSRPE